jgi:hypothetical protein
MIDWNRRHVLGLLLGCGALVPGVLEAQATTVLREALERCDDDAHDVCGGLDAIDLDAGGLRIRGAWVERAGFEVRTTAVVVHPGYEGWTVHVDGLDLDRSPTPRTTRSDAPQAMPSSPRARRRGLRSTRIDTHGIPVTIIAPGRIELPSHAGIDAVVHDPVIRISRRGAVGVELAGELRRGAAWVSSAERLHAHPAPDSWRAWSIAGSVSIAGGKPLLLDAEVEPDRSTIAARDSSGGLLHVDVRGPDDARRVTAHARDFGLDTLGSLADPLASRWGVHLRTAQLSGGIALKQTGDMRVELHLDEVSITGLGIEHPKLSRDRVEFETAMLSGDLVRAGPGEVSGRLKVSHGPLHAELWGAWGPGGLDLHGVLPTVPCQALLDGLPPGITGIAQGMALRGELEASSDLAVSAPDLARLRASGVDAIEHPPGRLDIVFPFVEQCTVEADPPALDLVALSGPYHHHFVDGRGRTRSRTLARGAEGYLPLPEMTTVARAFVTLEDSRFWLHDGFDREQMRKALWHNLVAGGIRRGASTITQQTARNLFLGIDRSLSRKLQEALLTSRLEHQVSKARILEIYLNIIELGPGIHGVEDAAWYYFGKSAADLDVLEAVHLASLAPAPHAYGERFKDGTVDERWLQELRHQVQRMYWHGLTTRDQMLRAQRTAVELLAR